MRFPHTIGIVRAPLTTDAKNNQVRNWSAATSTPAAAWVQPASSDEQNLNQDRVVSRWRLFLEAAADCVATDRVTWAGNTYQVDGEIQRWDDKRGAVHHYEGLLKRVQG